MASTGLLTLPAELRLLIWELLFDDEPDEALPDHDSTRPPADLTDPPISRVCRLMRAETLPLCYKIMTPRLEVVPMYSSARLRRTADRLSAARFQPLRKITFLGTAQYGRVSIVLTAALNKILDARWQVVDHLHPLRMRMPHCHIQDVNDLATSLRTTEHFFSDPLRNRTALLIIFDAILSLMCRLNIYNTDHPLHAPSTKLCDCSELVAPRSSVDGQGTEIGFDNGDDQS